MACCGLRTMLWVVWWFTKCCVGKPSWKGPLRWQRTKRSKASDKRVFFPEPGGKKLSCYCTIYSACALKIRIFFYRALEIWDRGHCDPLSAGRSGQTYWLPRVVTGASQLILASLLQPWTSVNHRPGPETPEGLDWATAFFLVTICKVIIVISGNRHC